MICKAGLLVITSDGVTIPGNADLDATDRAQRVEQQTPDVAEGAVAHHEHDVSRPVLRNEVGDDLVDAAEERVVLSLTDLAAAAGEPDEPTTIEVGGRFFRLHVPDSADAVRAEAEGPGTEPPGLRMAFWFAWPEFYPEVRIWNAITEDG